ncbi:MAG: multiheme c-type cytochrome [Aureliella sp.]
MQKTQNGKDEQLQGQAVSSEGRYVLITMELGKRIASNSALMLAMACSLVLALGCDQSKSRMTADSKSENEPESSTSETVDGVSSTPVTADIPPEAVNDEGLVVLGAPQSESVPEPESDDASPQQEDSATASTPISLASSSEKKTLPAEANVVSQSELNQVIAPDWPEPQAVLYLSGQQHGYIEPCGCTGLDKQKGGLIRRDTLLADLRSKGWNLIPIDVGNQVRRSVRQSEIKFETTLKAMEMMDYKAVAFGVDDLKLSSVELIQLTAHDPRSEGPEFLATNVVLIEFPDLFKQYRIVESGGRKIGITAALGYEHKEKFAQIDDVTVSDPIETLKPIVKKLESEGCDYVVLLAHASIEESQQMGREVPGIDLVVTAGGYGEPRYRPEPIDGSDAVMVEVGTKGMYGGIVGLFDDASQPVRYQRIAISAQFKDSPRMLDQFAAYQNRLKELGFDKLGAKAVANAEMKFVGSETCGECHTTAFEIWENSPHVHATESLLAANNDRGGIPRHHDPECVSCHATGWNLKDYYPYETGFISPETTEHMMGSGCENCHGPGKAHVDAEYGDVETTNEELERLRQAMVIKLEDVRQNKCINCHDLDNSPDFQPEEAFDEYWEQVKHYGKD